MIFGDLRQAELVDLVGRHAAGRRLRERGGIDFVAVGQARRAVAGAWSSAAASRIAAICRSSAG